MLSINNRIVARGTRSSSLTEAKIGGRSRGGGGGGCIAWGARHLFWNSFIVGEGDRGIADGVRVIGRWLLTLLTTRLDMRLVLSREMVITANITAHRSDSILSRE